MKWDDIEEDGEGPVEVGVGDFDDEPLSSLPEKAILHVLEDYWPEIYVSREGKLAVLELEEHIYSKFWSHKYHARVFCDAMLRAVHRLIDEGAPFDPATLESDDDIHLFVRWRLRLDSSTPGRVALHAAKDAFEAVWERANAILDNSDSVLVLGKDTGEQLERLKQIQRTLEERGHLVYLIKEEPDRLGESILQKVLRYALSSRFVIIENTEPSGHLYEVPHVAKMAECVVAVLQEQGKGATWMFEDAYFKHRHWKKFEYRGKDDLAEVVLNAAAWARESLREFGDFQRVTLPWFKKGKDS